MAENTGEMREVEPMVEVNKYEWDQTSKIETRDNKVYYRSLKVIGNAGSIVIRTGSHVTIEDEGRDRKFRCWTVRL